VRKANPGGCREIPVTPAGPTSPQLTTLAHSQETLSKSLDSWTTDSTKTSTSHCPDSHPAPKHMIQMDMDKLLDESPISNFSLFSVPDSLDVE
jgi:hypothetical protein